MSRFLASSSSEFLLSLGMWPDCPHYVSFRPLKSPFEAFEHQFQGGFPVKQAGDSLILQLSEPELALTPRVKGSSGNFYANNL